MNVLHTFLPRGAAGVALALATLLLLSSNPANAQSKFYIGGDFSMLKASYSDESGYKELADDGFRGFGVHVGSRLNQRFGVELGYTQLGGSKKSVGITGASSVSRSVLGVTATYPANTSLVTEVSLTGFNLDGLFYLPLGSSGKVEGIATAGLTRWEGEVKTSFDKPIQVAGVTVPAGTTATLEESDIGMRIGGGVQFNLTDQFSMRGLVRYYPIGDYEDIVDSAWDATIGFNFSF